jgi:tRNA pseudouridine55 synthase
MLATTARMKPTRTERKPRVPDAKKNWRRVNGILLLDKPPGMSSNQALQRVRHLFHADKGGHTGSLDPLATGLLPICFGEATKLAGLLLGETKSYSARAVLGATTDTDDADGVVLRTRPVPVLTDAMIDAALAPLRGRIRQRPPIYSALKREGEPLYAKARRGEAIEVAEREVEVQRIDCVQHGADGLGHNWLQLEIDCGSGTYVRSLVRDLGETLGCGAHVSVLRRLWVEPFRTPRMWTLEELLALAAQDPTPANGSSPEPDFTQFDACLLPIEAGLAGLPSLRVDPAQALLLAQGKPQHVDSAAGVGTLAVYDQAGRALGLASLAADGTLRAQRLFTWAAELAQSSAIASAGSDVESQ